jgi:hypothetical protein
MLSNPTPERAIVDTVVDVVSHEVGMVYVVVLVSLIVYCILRGQQYWATISLVVAGGKTVEVHPHP